MAGAAQQQQEVDGALARVAASEFHRNMQLLGFFAATEAQHVDGKQLGADMFDSLACNEGGLLVMVHFLLRKLKGAALVKEMSSCFPVTDNAQRREFKTKARAHFEQLERDHVVPFGTARGSTLNMAKGKAAQVLVWALSHAVLRLEAARTEKKLSSTVYTPPLQDLPLQDLPPLAHMVKDVLSHDGIRGGASQVTKLEAVARREQARFEQLSTGHVRASEQVRVYVDELRAQKLELQGTIESLDKSIAERSVVEEGCDGDADGDADGNRVGLCDDASEAAVDKALRARQLVIDLAAHKSLAALREHAATISSHGLGSVRLPDGVASLEALIRERIAPQLNDLETALAACAPEANEADFEQRLLDVQTEAERLERTAAQVDKARASLHDRRAAQADDILTCLSH